MDIWRRRSLGRFKMVGPSDYEIVHGRPAPLFTPIEFLTYGILSILL
jgi:hypothetical protein